MSAPAQVAIGQHHRALRALHAKVKRLPRLQQTIFQQRAKRHARQRAPLRRAHRVQRGIRRRHRRNPPPRQVDVFTLALDAQPMAAQLARHRTRCAAAKKRIEHHVAGIGAGQQHTVQQRLRFLCGVRLVPVHLQAFLAAAQGQAPVTAHLQIIIERLERLMVEGVARALGLLRPQQRLMRVCKAHAAKVWHRVGLHPHHIVQDPVLQILQHCAHAVNVVVAANHPKCAGVLQHAPAALQPRTRECIVCGKIFKLIPRIRNRSHTRAVRPVERLLQLQVVGRIGKHHIH